MTEAKFQLGRRLFYDNRLSGNATQACASCHAQQFAFSDGARRSTGSTGDRLPRNAPSLTNVAYNASLNWANPGLTGIEQQVQTPLFGEAPVEMGIAGRDEEILARLKADPRYQDRFAQAFPDADSINWKNVVYALATFTRGLTSFNSAYDRFIAGDGAAMSERARRGMALFSSEQLKCQQCHGGFNFSMSTVGEDVALTEPPFFNTGLYNLDSNGAYPPDNPGVKGVTDIPSDMGRFRPPTLRNIALTAPYMHDGSMDTLEEVVRFYERGGRKIERGDYAGDGALSPLKSDLVAGFQITDAQRRDLIAFLSSLTDESFVANPRFSDPFVVDSDSTQVRPVTTPVASYGE